MQSSGNLSRFTSLILTLVLSFICFLSKPALALNLNPTPPRAPQDGSGLSKLNNLLIGADKALRKKDIVELHGNVQLIFQGQHLAADHAQVNFTTKEVIASGQVILQNASTTVEAQELRWNYETNVGTFYRGFVQSGQVFFEGEVIEKTGEQNYIATKANYTACDTCPPGWGFSGRKIEAEMGGYAYIHNTTLRFGGIPVFWSPYLVVPLKSKRQTGLLPPGFGYRGSGGLAYNQRFFWTISKSQDATFGAQLYQKRGLEGLFNYRYVLTEDSKGDLDFSYIKDRLFADDDAFKRNHLDPGWAVDRWRLRYNHQYFLPDGFVHKMNLNMVRDLRYPRDFPDEMAYLGDPALDNRMSLTKNTENHHISMDSSYYVNLLQDNPLADNRLTVHRMPEIRYSKMEQSLFSTPFVYSLDAKYSNFVREGLSHDDIARTGCAFSAERCLEQPNFPTGAPNPSYDPKFNPDRDLIRTGQRFILQPSIALPFQAGPYIDVVPRTTVTHNQYSFGLDPAAPQPGQTPDQYDYNSHPSMTTVRNSVSAKTQFGHVYGDLQDTQATRWKHSFEPEVTYTTVPYLRRSNHPFFGPLSDIPSYRRDQALTDLDFENLDPNSSTGLQFDYNDRLFDRNVAGLILHNYLTRKVVKGSTVEYMRVAQLNISETYDYDEEKKGADRRRPWGAIKTLLDVRFENFNTNTVVNWYPYHRVSDIASRVMLNDKTKFIQATYTQQFVITEQIPADYNTRSETLGFAAGYDYKYARLKGGITWSLVTEQLQSWDYGLDLKPPGNCLVVHFGMRKIVINPEPDYHISFDFKFDGQG